MKHQNWLITAAPELDQVTVSYDHGKRKVKCFCGSVIGNSIVPHMRIEHSDVWKRWSEKFVEQKNAGRSPRQIMEEFASGNRKLLFSWTVIEREIRKMVENGTATIEPTQRSAIKSWEPENFKLEDSTVWDFGRRGSWAVHSSEYRGNWAPQVARNLILKYSRQSEIVLDPFMGGGTTLIEAWLLGRKGIGLDISRLAYQVTRHKLKQMEEEESTHLTGLDRTLRPLAVLGDARNVTRLLQDHSLGESSVHLIATHPPYLDSLPYTTHMGDLSRIHGLDQFCTEMRSIAVELYKLLMPGRICAILIGDTRKKGRVIPLGFRTMQEFLSVGFELKDIIVKLQWHDSSTEFYFGNARSPDHLLAHEYLFIFSKPTNGTTSSGKKA